MATVKSKATKKTALKKETKRTSNHIDLHTPLREQFGFKKFKGDQEAIIHSILSG